MTGPASRRPQIFGLGLGLDQRGFVLPAATLALLLLTTLVMAFAVMSASEPTIAANHLRAAQARALAEAGVEHAVSALSARRLPDPLPAAGAPAPYDGLTWLPLGPGGRFAVSVAAGATPHQRVIQAVGVALPPSAATSSGSRRRLSLTVHRLPWLDPPAPATVAGDLQIGASARVDARADASCGAKAALHVTGRATAGGTAYGYGDDVDSGAAPDRVTGAPPSSLDGHLFTAVDLDSLRAFARCCGEYLTGDQAFSDSRPVPANGLVFVDGVPCVGAACPAAAPGPRVTVAGDAAPAGAAEFRGWLIVNGSLAWTGATRARGLVYVQDTLAFAGTGLFLGAVVAGNASGGSSRLDGASLQWDCQAARTGGGTLPVAWLPKAGTFREIPE